MNLLLIPGRVGIYDPTSAFRVNNRLLLLVISLRVVEFHVSLGIKLGCQPQGTETTRERRWGCLLRRFIYLNGHRGGRIAHVREEGRGIYLIHHRAIYLIIII